MAFDRKYERREKETASRRPTREAPPLVDGLIGSYPEWMSNARAHLVGSAPGRALANLTSSAELWRLGVIPCGSVSCPRRVL